MELTGLHLLLTYQCTFECDHCFVWSSPFQSGTMTVQDVRHILTQAKAVSSVNSIYFEGGEPFMFYPVLVAGVKLAHNMGFQVGIVSNAYWATSVEDATCWLEPFQGIIDDLSVSSDRYHYNERISQQAKNAQAAAENLDIPLGIISVAQPETVNATHQVGQLPAGESGIMYRGRAVENLSARADKHPWVNFDTCPYEDLRDPGRVHIDPLGNLHICQGISIGNLFEKPIKEICEAYNPETHPITSHLLSGGPIELAKFYNLPHEEEYADACHFCYEVRVPLRQQFPEILTPDQVYGIY